MNNLIINDIYINGVRGKRMVGINRKPYVSSYEGLINPSIANIPSVLDTTISAFDVLMNPIEFLKVMLQVCIDLSFSVSAIVSIVSLCMFVFSGCKDRNPLKYVGLSVSVMYIIVTIFTAFIDMA